jgi:hypothetical protein
VVNAARSCRIGTAGREWDSTTGRRPFGARSGLRFELLQDEERNRSQHHDTYDFHDVLLRLCHASHWRETKDERIA